MSQRSSAPPSMSSASARVVTAIVPSAAMTSALRFTRSAHTPPKIETTACGRNPKSVLSASTAPDFVSIVRCHMTAYCTSIEPKRETVCPERKIAVSRRHRGLASVSSTGASGAAPSETSAVGASVFSYGVWLTRTS